MVSAGQRQSVEMELHTGGPGRVLIIEAPYYLEITEALIAGAKEVLDAAQVAFDRVVVPGALEIPQAFAQAVAAGRFDPAGDYTGAIVAGCVIRGETSHYDIVCNMTNHWLMDTAIKHRIPLGNAVLTVDTEAQALARARGGAAGKGGDAARACLRLLRTARDFGVARP
jgi:6,7-dimethyl-8-ribityllumazine synthase